MHRRRSTDRCNRSRSSAQPPGWRLGLRLAERRLADPTGVSDDSTHGVDEMLQEVLLSTIAQVARRAPRQIERPSSKFWPRARQVQSAAAALAKAVDAIVAPHSSPRFRARIHSTLAHRGGRVKCLLIGGASRLPARNLLPSRFQCAAEKMIQAASRHVVIDWLADPANRQSIVRWPMHSRCTALFAARPSRTLTGANSPWYRESGIETPRGYPSKTCQDICSRA
jgi:hypothetical protein